MPTTSAVSTSIAGLRYQTKQMPNGAPIFLKNAVTAYSVTGSSGAFTQITSAGYPTTTVPGAVFLNQSMFVQDINGGIFQSSTGSIINWGSLDFITPEKEPSCAVAVAKSLNYLAAFKEWDTEFFAFDPNAVKPGSSLITIDSNYLKLGCATAESIIEFDGGIIFMSKRDQAQRSREIHVLNGLTPKKISTPEVERILNNDDLATCYALYLSTAGHQFYVLTLKTSAITLVYDFNTGYWYEWSFLTAQGTQSVSNITHDDVVATATIPNHGFNDGDPIVIAGANESPYNGSFQALVIDANTLQYYMASDPGANATGTITVFGYDESYFPGVAYTTYNNVDLVLHETNGIIYALDATGYDDNGAPINFAIRTPLVDGDNLDRKQFVQACLVSDLTTSYAYLRATDDDYASYSNYQPMELATYDKSDTPPLGQARRRGFEVRCTSTVPLRWESLEFTIQQGK